VGPYNIKVVPEPTVCKYASPFAVPTPDNAVDVDVFMPTLSDFISSPPSGEDPGPTKKGISNLL
jgi:hypothetical protein